MQNICGIVAMEQKELTQGGNKTGVYFNNILIFLPIW